MYALFMNLTAEIFPKELLDYFLKVQEDCGYSAIVFKVVLVMGWVFCSYLLLAENGAYSKLRKAEKDVDAWKKEFSIKDLALDECKQLTYDRLQTIKRWQDADEALRTSRGNDE